jgi:hypothetical protein
MSRDMCRHGFATEAKALQALYCHRPAILWILAAGRSLYSRPERAQTLQLQIAGGLYEGGCHGVTEPCGVRLRERGPKDPAGTCSTKHDVWFVRARTDSVTPLAQAGKARESTAAPCSEAGSLPPSTSELTLIKRDTLTSLMLKKFCQGRGEPHHGADWVFKHDGDTVS